jgi:hypothetical protein
MRYIYVLLLSICVHGSTSGQFEQLLGEWKSHIPLREGTWVTQSEKSIIYSTGRALVSFSKEDLSHEVFTTIEGLSGASISRVEYDLFNQQLIIIYTDSDIDVIKDGSIINLPFIRRNTNIIGSREILDFHLHDRNLAFMATAFGLIELNPVNLEFRSTTFTNLIVNAVCTTEDFLYAATEDGLYRVALTVSNKADFLNWEFMSSDYGLPAIYESNHLAFFNDQLFMVADGQLFSFRQAEGNFEIVDLDIPPGFNFEFINQGKDRLLIGLKDNQFSSKLYILNRDGAITNLQPDCTNRILYAIEDEKERIWYADEWRGFRYSNTLSGDCQNSQLSGPNSYEARQINVKDGVVYVASGGIRDNFDYLNSRAGFYIYENKNWSNINESNTPILRDWEFLNISCILPHPRENKLYIGSYFSGVIEMDMATGEMSLFDRTNSALQGRTGDLQRTTVIDMKFDRNGNLWILNYEAERPIVVYTSEGVWHSFTVPGSRSLSSLEIDAAGNLWFPVFGSAGSVLVYNPGNNIADPSDDRYKQVNRSNSVISTGVIYSVKADLDNAIWVGTGEGPVVFRRDPFSDNFDGFRPPVVVDEIPALLLQTEEILCIEVDGANRKWFGTRNGIFVQSSDGTVEEMRLNTRNSPLFNNTINALRFEPRSGVMYIASNLGIQSYRTSSTGANNRHSSEVYAFPNPVRPEYDGPIAIRGLARDAEVKITDINGKLIFETNAEGGQAIWDGRDYNGRRAASGVYLVFSSGEVSFGQHDSFVTKIMLIN